MAEIETKHFKRPRILFVDDEPAILSSLSRSFRSLGKAWDLLFVDSVAKAIEAIKVNPCEIVVTDLAMPKQSGMDLLFKLRSISPQTRCIVLTGQADLDIACKVVNNFQVIRFYTKPCDVRTLSSGIEGALLEITASVNNKPPQRNWSDADFLNKLSTGVLLLGWDRSLIQMNRKAEEIVADGNFLVLGKKKVLRGYNAEHTKLLKSAIHEIREGTNSSQTVALSIERRSSSESLKVIITPLQNIGGKDAWGVAMFVVDPAKVEDVPSELLASLFDLTYREGEVARHLLNGANSEELSKKMGITILSARTYIKRVMSKTGTNRQSDLLRLLMSARQIIS